MRRPRLAALSVGILLLLGACGRESIVDDAGEIVRAGASPTPRATAMPDQVAATPTPDTTGSPTPTGAAATDAPQGGAATPTPAAAADDGGVNQAKAGTYVFDVSGEASDPFNPAAPPEKFEGERTAKVTTAGNVTTREDTSSEEAGRTTIRTRHEPSQVLLLSFKAESQAGDFSCELDPPLVITKIPVKPEKFPTQQFKGSGNACNGKLDIEVLKQETVKDAKGADHQTWQVKVRQEIRSGQFTLVNDEMRWVSPDLGVEIRSNSVVNATFGGQKVNGKSNAVLRDHP